MRLRLHRPARGFTLIEVLVALAIVVIGIAALLSTLSSAADTTAYLRDKTFAEWVGFNQIAAVRLALQPTPNGTSEGDVDYAGRKWHYLQDIEDLQLPGMRRIDVNVVLVTEGKTPGKDSYTATVSSILGSALAPPNGILPDWDDGTFPGRPATNTNGGTTTTPGSGGVTTGGTTTAFPGTGLGAGGTPATGTGTNGTGTGTTGSGTTGTGTTGPGTATPLNGTP